MAPSLMSFLEKNEVFDEIEFIGINLFHFLAGTQVKKIVRFAKIVFDFV
jgi:Kef-type K+ transport system membrane component KefB